MIVLVLLSIFGLNHVWVLESSEFMLASFEKRTFVDLVEALIGLGLAPAPLNLDVDRAVHRLLGSFKVSDELR